MESIQHIFPFLPIIGAILAGSAVVVSIRLSIREEHQLEGRRRKFLVPTASGSAGLAKITNEAIFQLSNYATTLKPDYIVGINRGGAMLGAFLALGLGTPSRNFRPCFVDPDENSVDLNEEDIEGVVLVVDDICRSGKTTDLIVRHIKNHCRKVTRLENAVLITTVDQTLRPTCKHLDYFAFMTLNKSFRLPWTRELKEDNFDPTSIQRRKQFDEIREEPLEILAGIVHKKLQFEK